MPQFCDVKDFAPGNNERMLVETRLSAYPDVADVLTASRIHEMRNGIETRLENRIVERDGA